MVWVVTQTGHDRCNSSVVAVARERDLVEQGAVADESDLLDERAVIEGDVVLLTCLHVDWCCPPLRV